MSITSYKITDSDISSKGVVAAPTVLSGSPEENKKVFDRLVREVLKGDFNALVDALATSTGAGEIGAAVEGLTGETVQAVLSALKIGLDSKAASADVDAALEGKSDSSVTDTHIKSVAFDADTGVFTFTKENGTAVEIDTALEKVAVNFAYDEDTQSLILTLADGSTQRVSLAAFLTTTEFEDSDTLKWSVTADGGKVRADVKAGSITDTMLNSALKAMLRGYVSKAGTSATNAAASESASLSYRTDAQTAAAEAAARQTAAAGYAAKAQSAANRAEAASAHPPRISGDGYWELWDLTQSAYVKTTYQARGPVGKDGNSYTVKGLYATLSALQAAHSAGSAGDAWFVGTADSNVVYQWDVDKAAWVNVGPLKGPSGAAFTYDDFTPEQLAALKGDDGTPGIVISETQPADASHPVWLDPNGDDATAAFADSGNGNLVLNGAADQTAKRYFASALFPGLAFKYIPVVHGGTFADPYGIKVNSGMSLVDAINALTEPGIYTIYQNRASTDVPDGAKAINSSLRGFCCLSQISKHYAYILMIDQASNLYVQYIQGDVGGGWKTMFQSEAAASGVKNPNALTIKIGSQSITYDGSSAQTVEIADGSEVAY